MIYTDPIPDLANETGDPASRPAPLPESRRSNKEHPRDYKPEPALVDAIRSALLLRRPLLLTGEPGTGKTQAAHYLSWKGGYGEEALRFEAKSTSQAKDLFYTFRTIDRFHDTTAKSVSFIRYNALGEAILRAKKNADVEALLPKGFAHAGEPRQSVVLIDEIDKAPRDFPNDVLNQLEHMRFSVPELESDDIQAEKDFWPLVILTSNSERNLPAPFLRRCVYYNIARPDRTRFADILKARLKFDPASALAKDALDFLMYLRGDAKDLQGEVLEPSLSKKPATSELLDWLLVMEARGARRDQRFRDVRSIVEGSLSTVVKDPGRDVRELLNRVFGR